MNPSQPAAGSKVYISYAWQGESEGEHEGTAETEGEEPGALDIEGLDADLAQLLSRRLRQDMHVDVWADDGQESVCLLIVERVIEEDSLLLVIALNRDLPARLRMPRANKDTLVNDQGFEVDEEGTLTLALGAASEADAAELADVVCTALALGFDLPQDDCTLSTTLDAM